MMKNLRATTACGQNIDCKELNSAPSDEKVMIVHCFRNHDGVLGCGRPG
jgi:hypothetical protein